MASQPRFLCIVPPSSTSSPLAASSVVACWLSFAGIAAVVVVVMSFEPPPLPCVSRQRLRFRMTRKPKGISSSAPLRNASATPLSWNPLPLPREPPTRLRPQGGERWSVCPSCGKSLPPASQRVRRRCRRCWSCARFNIAGLGGGGGETPKHRCLAAGLSCSAHAGKWEHAGSRTRRG